MRKSGGESPPWGGVGARGKFGGFPARRVGHQNLSGNEHARGKNSVCGTETIGGQSRKIGWAGRERLTRNISARTDRPRRTPFLGR